MDCFIGIDLGSTTTKAIVLDSQANVIGRGITNSRSDYDVACNVARTEAYIDARFGLLKQKCLSFDQDKNQVIDLEKSFRLEQFLEQLKFLITSLRKSAEDDKFKDIKDGVDEFIDFFDLEAVLYGEKLFMGEMDPTSDFFRDLSVATYNQAMETFAMENNFSVDALTTLFDMSIISVENEEMELGFNEKIKSAYQRVFADESNIKLLSAIETVSAEDLNEVIGVGTGYGRMRLPFPKEHIRSEILCHGLGANAMFPGTRTVLDIGGQDTKGIQVDDKGIVTAFQMNDRCAAGCGRYLGYIAEEMKIPLPELGPMAMASTKVLKINSTCTVFAGAEMRDRLADGHKREDIVMGLHRAIIFRAMSLLARSGGVKNEFTFTGGVAKNEAAVKALDGLIEENFGKGIKMNIAAESIFTGARGAAIFAHREVN